MSDPAPPRSFAGPPGFAEVADGPLLLFDGGCRFCRSAVRFMQCRHGGGRRLRFASLQSDVGRAALVRHGFPADYLDSVVLIEEGRPYTESTASWRVGRYLAWPWRAAVYGRLLPKPLRDQAYAWVSKNRGWLPGPGGLCAVHL